MPDAPNLEPLFRDDPGDVPAPDVRRGRTAAGARHQPRRLAVPRPARAVPRSTRARCARARRSRGAARRHPADREDHRAAHDPGAGAACRPTSAGPGDIIAVAGIPEITIGETLADLDDPRPLPLITVDEPAISMTHRHQHLAARRPGQGHTRSPPAWSRTASTASSSATCRSGCCPTERPDAWEVQGRGELALAILVEQMRREGFELTVGKPQVVTREIDGKVHEPVERLTIDVPGGVPRRDHPAAGCPQGPDGADGQPRHRLGPHGVPRAGAWPDRLPHRVPHRDPWHRHRPPRLRGLRAVGRRPSGPGLTAPWSPTAPGSSTPYAMVNLQERGTLFVEPGARRSTRAWSSARTRAPTTWTSTSRRRRS